MTAVPQDVSKVVSNEPNKITEAPKQDDREINFRKQERMYQKLLEDERKARQEAERLLQEKTQKSASVEENESDEEDEPYVDHKRLARKFSKFEEQLEKKIEKRAEEKARSIYEEEKKQQWLSNNPDFYEVMNLADKFAEKDPELAETILKMPDTFERYKLVYKNIKAYGLHKSDDKPSEIQNAINNNKKGLYYQPTGMSTPPYSSRGDFSPQGQRTAYDKMKELQSRLRMG